MGLGSCTGGYHAFADTPYKYLRLTGVDQLKHHRSEAFARVLALARDPSALQIRVGVKPKPVHGAILVRDATTPDGCAAVMAAHGFADVHSVEGMLTDLARLRPAG